MATSIRSFEPHDFAAAKALWRSTDGVGLSDADEREPIERFLLRNPGLSQVACEGDALVGTILCGHDGRRGLIHHLVVSTRHRRQGLGHALVRQALAGLRAQGIDKCHLLVFTANTEGLAFWRRVAAVERKELALFSLNARSDV
jgi:ribosomal protein S18 acetylase RimI-like enzyme